jgi:hypothetical protein
LKVRLVVVMRVMRLARASSYAVGVPMRRRFRLRLHLRFATFDSRITLALAAPRQSLEEAPATWFGLLPLGTLFRCPAPLRFCDVFALSDDGKIAEFGHARRRPAHTEWRLGRELLVRGRRDAGRTAEWVGWRHVACHGQGTGRQFRNLDIVGTMPAGWGGTGRMAHGPAGWRRISSVL